MRFDTTPLIVLMVVGVPFAVLTQFVSYAIGISYVAIMQLVFIFSIKRHFLFAFRRKFMGKKSECIVRMTTRDRREAQYLVKNPDEWKRGHGDAEETYHIKGSATKFDSDTNAPIYDFYQGYPDNIDPFFVKLLKDAKLNEEGLNKRAEDIFNQSKERGEIADDVEFTPLDVPSMVPLSHDAKLLNTAMRTQWVLGFKHGLSKFMSVVQQNKMILLLTVIGICATVATLALVATSMQTNNEILTLVKTIEAASKANTITAG